jgi:hypothetical protein
MEEFLRKFADPYERKARLYPAIIALIPVIAGIALYTDWFIFDVTNTIFIAFIAAILFWLSGKSRDSGKAVEKRLIPEWGGMPSVTLLRHRDCELDKYTKQRYHKAAELLVGINMPSCSDEERNPDDADERYRSVTTALLSRTRSVSGYALIFKENINYGFWRNMRGLKSISLVIALLIIFSGIWRDRELVITLEFPDGVELAVIVIGVFSLVAWIFTITDEAVRRAAQSYALRLLEALDEIQSIR